MEHDCKDPKDPKDPKQPEDPGKIHPDLPPPTGPGEGPLSEE